jgi:beta-xylosidase
MSQLNKWPGKGDHPWIADNQDGTYRNPILFADCPDPDVIRVGSDFYMTASSFTFTPGLPVMHSRDLVNWRIIGHGVKNLPHERYVKVQSGCGIWAPSLRFHAGKFFIFFATPDEGIFHVFAENPAGPWSTPHLIQAGQGLIDPCPLWTDDGKAYLVHAYAFSRSGIKHCLRVRPMAADASCLLGEGRIVFDDPQRHPTCEGPKFYEWNGLFYILAPAGGVSEGWQLALRASDPMGPYETRVVLEQGNTPINGPHQGGLVDAPDGTWWFVHFQHLPPYGRIPHLQPVSWENDWPLIGVDHDGNGIGEPVPEFRKPVDLRDRHFNPAERVDHFDQKQLGLQWHWQANHKPEWASLNQREGCLRLFPQPAESFTDGNIPHALLQNFPALSFTTEAHIDGSNLREGQYGGLVIAGVESACLLVSVSQGVQTVSLHTPHGLETRVVSEGNILLRTVVREGGVCRFSFDCDGKRDEFETEFQATEALWVGARIGLMCILIAPDPIGGFADFDYFSLLPGEPRELQMMPEAVRSWRPRPVDVIVKPKSVSRS